MRTTRRLAVAAAAVLAVGLSACSAVSSGAGGSTGSGGSGGSQASADAALAKAGPDHGWSQTNVTVDPKSLACGGKAPDPTRGVTATSVKVGGLAYLTSPTGSTFATTDAGAKARFARANAEGGVAGRKIDFTGVLDDGNDPSRSGTQAQVLVEQQKVFAVAPLMVGYPNFLDTLCKNVVPFFGWGFNSGFCGNLIGFGISGCQTPAAGQQRAIATGVPAAVTPILGSGSKTLAVIGEDNDASRLGNTTISKGFTAGGYKTVYQTNTIPSTGLTDAGPIVSALMRSDHGQPPGVLFLSSQLNSAIKIIGAVKAAGFKGVVLTPYYDPRLATAQVLDGTYAALQWQPGISTDIPGIAQMIKDFNRYAPGTVLSLPSMAGYWSADMLVKGLQKTGRNLTVDRFLQVMNDDYSNSVPGALPETRWPVNHAAATPCGTLAHLADQKWSAPAETCSSIAKAQ